MKTPIEINLVEAKIEQHLRGIALSLLHMRKKLVQFKANLLTAKDFGQLQCILNFEAQLELLVSHFNIESIDQEQKITINSSSFSDELKKQIGVLVQIKEQLVKMEDYASLGKMKSLESGIVSLITLMD